MQNQPGTYEISQSAEGKKASFPPIHNAEIDALMVLHVNVTYHLAPWEQKFRLLNNSETRLEFKIQMGNNKKQIKGTDPNRQDTFGTKGYMVK